ncbi:FAD-dependent oxidoreductase [Streptomyces tailanensis]|uniref:FAD-dependent oxidoreductase n=1 Tax=Streptomyces tailanensis TaxID=2569858 RepID=UPI00122DFC68|nr:FAD-dependent oxidoreductase [Streptomyces tailanensis]
MAEIVVIGGGIGGLAAALSISRQGHRVMVVERADRFAEIGAGIQIAPNGIYALERLGLGEAVRASAVLMDELRFMDGVTGEHVVSMPLTEEYRRRFRNPYAVVHRAELHSLLLNECAASDMIRLRVSGTAVGYDSSRDSVTVMLDNGVRITGDAVIGADGINSAIRRQLVGDGEPRVSGITIYRAIVRMERVPSELRSTKAVTWWAGPGCHFVHYPIARGSYLNLAASIDDRAPEAFAGVPASREHVLRQFAVLGETAQRLLQLGEDWRSWVLVDRDPVDSWSDGRVVLLGDAAHPMLHYAAQGACQALEDAVFLGDLLNCPSPDFPGRFEQFCQNRRKRTARIQTLARESVRLWHPSGDAAKARNSALSSLTPTELHDYVAWMHSAPASWHVPAGT